MTDLRTLSLLERYAFHRSQLGFPQCISFVVAYPTLPTLEFLHTRLTLLQVAWSHLRSRIEDGPNWVQGAPRHANELVANVPASGTLGDVLKQEQARFKANPSLFRVTRYTGASSYLGLTVAHELADGLGSLQLLHAILCTDTLRPESTPTPMEDIVDIRVPPLAVIGVALRKILLPKLPTFIYSPPDNWPGVVAAPPTSCGDGLSLISLTPALLDNLTTSREKHPTVSIHSLIATAWTLALSSVVGARFITVGTPRSERPPGARLGNYVSSLSFRFTPSLLKEPFWTIATTLNVHLKSETAIQSGRQSIGMLCYVPAGDRFWREQSDKAAPYDDSWELSNLGRSDLPQGATDMAWAQPGPILGPAVIVSMLRHRGGARLAISWREGCAVGEGVVQQVEGQFIKILEQL